MSEFTFSITPYNGFEDEVLNLRNNNRDTLQSREYMDWRYLGEKSQAHSPLILWIIDRHGERVGMVGIVFRPYWVNNKRYDFAVIGDISLNSNLRGKGIAKKMFEFMNCFFKEKHYSCAFVIPNFVAYKSLLSTGWKVEGTIVPHVFIINPWKKIYEIIKNKFLSSLAGRVFQQFVKIWMMFIPTRGITIENLTSFDRSFDFFWQRFDKRNLVIRDRSSAILTWRYKNHPTNKFKIIRFKKNNQFVGYIIYLINADKTTCTVYDLIFHDRDLIRPGIILFVRSLCRERQITSVRINLNSRHSYSVPLCKAGFFRRPSDNFFQVFPESIVSKYSSSWFLTSGDKDT